jgi:hypothetical protein
MKHRPTPDLSSAVLHLLAMALMLGDHVRHTLIPGNHWLTCLGRLAFPIFAFLLVEGYFHTKNLKKYMLRLLIGAIVSELPFDLAFYGRWFYPGHQNVLWTFLIALFLVHCNQEAKQPHRPWLRPVVGAASIGLALVIGSWTHIDYHHAGLLTVLVFFFFRGRTGWHFAGQWLCLGFIFTALIQSFTYEIELLGLVLPLPRQALALLALIPIWLYRGRQGHHSRPFQYACYAFYPLHLLILALAKLL